MYRSILFAAIILASTTLTGCAAADRQAFCNSTAISGTALGVWNPFAIPCIANDLYELGTKVAKATKK